ncbi:MAG: hypothetical protein Q9219_004948 [cf. Caloplaca sp. 3 TL-2023]
MHEYTAKDIKSCMSGHRIVFIGDSTIRQLFWATARKLNATAADAEIREAGKHEDLIFEQDDISVDFFWDPFLNTSSLRRELISYLDDLPGNADMIGKAGLVTIGGGLWFARHFESDWLDRFRDSFDYLAPLLGYRKGTRPPLYSPPFQERSTSHDVYVTPIQVPFYDFLSPLRASSMRREKINPMNEYLFNASKANGVKLAWSHSLMTWESEYAYEESGIHVIDNVSSRRVDVLLNMRCNAELSHSQGYPFDKTCCSAYETRFGHTVFFLRKREFSLKRLASVLVRLNLLSCLLPYIMGTDYLFYYFAPLVSFWYLVVYLTMRIGHTHNTSLAFLLGKVGVAVVVVTFLVRYPILFERVFLLLKHTCKISWNVKEWQFRVRLDSYIVFVGMVSAILYIKISDVLQTRHFLPHDRPGLMCRFWSRIRILSIILALVILPSFWFFASSFSAKVAYNQWVPYISPFPIVSFIILRNSNRFFRSYYSSVFAWLGRCSLETFTLQFHIWLAADTKGLLSLGIFGRKEMHIDGRRHDLVILTVIFLWLSWLTADATATVTNWIIDPKALKVVQVNGPTRPVELDNFEAKCHLGGLDERKAGGGTWRRGIFDLMTFGKPTTPLDAGCAVFVSKPILETESK